MHTSICKTTFLDLADLSITQSSFTNTVMVVGVITGKCDTFDVKSSVRKCQLLIRLTVLEEH